MLCGMGNSTNITQSRRVFAANMVRLRLEADLSQERFAEKIGFHRTYVSAVEGCKRNVSLDNIDKIAAALNVSPATLLTEFD
jgi:transcriptional regulator with XRE-family HTH domain